MLTGIQSVSGTTTAVPTTASASPSDNLPVSNPTTSTSGQSGLITGSQPSTSGLSPGAAAGVGVGTTLAVVALLACIVFFIWRRRRRQKGLESGVSQQTHQYPQDYYKPPGWNQGWLQPPGTAHNQPVYEAPIQGREHELEASGPPAHYTITQSPLTQYSGASPSPMSDNT
jgi:hypothetical protein